MEPTGINPAHLNGQASPASPTALILGQRRVGLVVESAELAKELRTLLSGTGATEAFHLAASAPLFEVSNQLERHNPEVLFVEFSRVPVSPLDWMLTVCGTAAAPLVVALHGEPDTDIMISALRAGAVEFLSLPLAGTVAESLERIAFMLEGRGSRSNHKGKLIGVVSAKGGCGATTVACHLGAALQRPTAEGRILVVDLDYQSAAAYRSLRVKPRYRVTDSFNAARRMNSTVWPEFVTTVAEGVDFLAGPPPDFRPPEDWRIETLFRFLTGLYHWILIDLGRQLHPANWSFLSNLDQLYVVTAPDVLALYQTRTMLQMLTSRGFERSRLGLILNRNESGPRDFWVESIRQMFEMDVAAAIPDDHGAMVGLPPDRYQFPEGSPFGKSVAKLAAHMHKIAEESPAGKAA